MSEGAAVNETGVKAGAVPPAWPSRKVQTRRDGPLSVGRQRGEG